MKKDLKELEEAAFGSNGQENHQQAVAEPVNKTRDHDNDSAKKTSQATQILSMLEDKKCEFFHSDSRVYATVPVHEHFETWPIRRKGFKQWAAYQFYLTHGKTPGSQALQDALTTIEGKAIHEGVKQDVHVRIGGSEEEIFIDLCNDSWEMIHITAQGWSIVPHGSVKFIRGVGMLPLPIPQRGGSLDILREFINVSSNDDWRLFIGWLINALRPTGPQLGMQLDGEQGAGKSWVSKILKALIDPNAAGERSEPREIRDLMIAARSNWILAFDNLSGLPVWLSDGLCRLSTGGAFGTRQLFTDEDEMIFEAKRPVIINGIGAVVTRPDLLDRYIILSLEQIPEDKRRPEKEFWDEFHSVSGLILGGLCDVLSATIAQRPSVKVSGLPRMADAVLWATAAEDSLGWEKGSFQKSYALNRDGANSTALESSLHYEPLCKLLEKPNTTWQGTAGELLSTLSEIVGESKAKQRAWPSSPRALRSDLQRIVPNLRSIGIKVKFPRGRKAGNRILELDCVGFPPSRPSRPSRPSKPMSQVDEVDEVDDLSGQKQGQSKSCPTQAVLDLC